MFDYEYEFDFANSGDAEGAFAVFLIIYLIYFLILFAVGVAQYVLQSAGMYAIAKRRGIRHPWLSWLPVGNSWVLGCISDQYQYVVKGKAKSKRKALLILTALTFVLSAVGAGVYVGSVMDLALNQPELPDSAILEFMPAVLVFLGAMAVVACISIAVSILTYMALYDLYTSCEPKNNVLYLVLSIFINVTMPIFVFVCRKKDLGMPPRKQEPEQIPLVQE